MKERKVIPAMSTDEAIFEMANIKKSETGLPFDIWVDSSGQGRSVGHSTKRIKIKKGGKEMSLSFYDNPKIEAGERNLKHFGEGDVNTVLAYMGKHKALFNAHNANEISDSVLGYAMLLIKKNKNIKTEDAIKQAKAVFD
jgi:hypothetical protein